MYLIVGLGNPGKEYETTRHNVGFMAVDTIARAYRGNFRNNKKCFAEVAEIQIGAHRVILAKPQTFMNESGRSVMELLRWFNVSPEKCMIIYDDMDLPVGEVRIREKGSSAGHHGIESLFSHLSNHSFVRVRVGIGRSDVMSGADYVLSRIPTEELGVLNLAIANDLKPQIEDRIIK